ncbi:tRNA (N(6)-L-threonylcarbamoyladenosine(37)-C(2))-methylthiotransferase MtaB [Amedibacillus sp. YH-ame10]
MTTFAIATLGCKVNTYESQGYESALVEQGYQQVSFKEQADIYIINTCAVTNTASAKSRQKIHQAHQLNPDALIVAIGCYVQSASDQVRSIDGVKVLIGSEGKANLVSLIKEAMQGHKPSNVMKDVRSISAFEALPIHKFEHQTRAFLKIQDGCNQFCSYCIIPYARGAERSLNEEEVLKIASDLVKNGHQEIVLAGIHTGRYGNGTGRDLLDLLKRMCSEVEGLERIRISSIEMNEISDALIEFMKHETKIARHLHIPIQSANNTVLKNMNRPYTIEWFQQRIQYIREMLPNVSISTDVITGFPQESEEDFADTLKNLKELNFSFLHVFPYSKRDYTKAADMKGHLDNKTKKERASILAQLSKELYTAYKQSFIGKEVSVIFEKEVDQMLFGHSSEYLEVYVEVQPGKAHTHELHDVNIVSFQDDRLYACLKEDSHEIIANV